LDVFDAFYQAYLTAIACGVAVLVGSDFIGDHHLTAATVHRVVGDGPAVVGLAIALIVTAGLRSGARGGPLVLAPADVRYVLLAPVPRRTALAVPAWRQVRFAGFAGTVTGAVLGVLVARRLSGNVAAWAASGAGAGLLVAALVTGLALLCSGRRVRPPTAVAAGLVLTGWSAADLVQHTRTSPLTLLGMLAVTPLRLRPVAFLALVLPIAAVLGGLAAVGGSSLEAAERRAALASQIRFALTFQDLRTVVLLRRQLNQERPRGRPWVRLGSLSRHRSLVWRRDVRGLARWPLVRIVRVVVLGAIAGAALAGVWAGTTPLLVVAALALYVAGFEVLEPLAQDVDHPDLVTSVPRDTGDLRLRHMPVSFATLVVVSAVGWGTSVAIAAATGRLDVAVGVGGVLIVPAAFLAACGSAVSVVMGPSAAGGGIALPVEMAGAWMLFRVLWPIVIVLVGLTPLLVARRAPGRHLAPAPAAVSAATGPLTVGALVLAWLRWREPAHEWWKQSASAS
jgi:hypothetical protein